MKKILIPILLLTTFLLIAQNVKREYPINDNLLVNGRIRTYGSIYPAFDTTYDLGDSINEGASYNRWRNVYARWGRFTHLRTDSLTVANLISGDTVIMIASGNDTIRIDTTQIYWTYDGSRKFRSDADSTNCSNNYFTQIMTLANAANTQNAFICSTTTDAGALAQIRRAMKVILIDGGFTGNNQTYAGYFYNSAGGTGASARNYGVLGYAVKTGGVHNLGLKGVSENGADNIGVFGQSTDDVNSAQNLGILGIASNDGITAYHCGGYFDLGTGVSIPTLAFSSTIIGDNHSYTCNHLTLMDKTKPVFEVADIGDSLAEVRIIGAGDTTIIRPEYIISDTIVSANDYNDTVYIGRDDITLYSVQRRTASAATYGIYSYAALIGAGKLHAGYFECDTHGTGERYGLYATGNARSANTNDIHGIYAEAIAMPGGSMTMYGGKFLGLIEGTGKGYGIYTTGQTSTLSACDSVFGIYSLGDGATGATNNKGTFGGYFKATGDGNDTCFGIYATASGGIQNSAGYFVQTFNAENAVHKAVVCSVTTAGAGAGATQIGFQTLLMPGYTGATRTVAGWFENGVIGAAGNSYNAGIYGVANGNASRDNYGVYGYASLADSTNIGVKGFSPVAETTSQNTGVYGIAHNPGLGTRGGIGGYFLYSPAILANPQYILSALVADNCTTSEYIFVGIDNKANVFEVDDAGDSAAMVRVIKKGADTTIISGTSITTDSVISHSYFIFGDTTTFNTSFAVVHDPTTHQLQIWRDTIFFTIAGAAAWDKGQARIWGADNPSEKLFLQCEGTIDIFGGGSNTSNNKDSSATVFDDGKVYPSIDTIVAGGTFPTVGTATKRWHGIWSRYYFSTDPSRADTFKWYSGVDSSFIVSDNPISINGNTQLNGTLTTSGIISSPAGATIGTNLVLSGVSVSSWSASEHWLSGGTNTPANGYIRVDLSTNVKFGTALNLIKLNGSSIILDTIIVYWNNTNGGGTLTVDSITLESCNLTDGTWTVEKKWVTGDATVGFRNINIVTGGDYTTEDIKNYRIQAWTTEAVNGNTVDYYGCKMVYHTQ